MARLLVVLALLGAAFVHANPTPPPLPRSLIPGLYASQPEKDVNYDEFAKVLVGSPFAKGATLGFRQDGDNYVQKFFFWAKNITIELPFKLGETQTKTIHGKNVEYVYTLEGEPTGKPVLHGKFRDTDGDVKFTVDAAFTETGIDATYTRNEVVAKRTYRRTLPPYVLGAFTTVPARLSPNAVEFYNRVFPLPTGLTWTEKSAFYFGRQGDSYILKFLPNPTYYQKIKFELNKPAHLKVGDEDIEFKYTITESTPNSTTIHGEYKSSTRGVVTSEAVYDKEGVTVTHKTETDQATLYFKRVVPWLFYGTFELVPEKTENWAEFMAGDQGCKIADTTTKYQIYRNGDNYAIRKELSTGAPIEANFTLNTPNNFTLPGNHVVEYTASVLGLKDDLILQVRTHVVGTERRIVNEIIAKPEGLQVSYRRGDVVGKKFYRRVVQKAVFGTFKSSDDSEDFKTFAKALNVPKLLKPTTIVIGEAPNHQITQTITPEGGPANTYTFTLGKQGTAEANGKPLKYTYYYYESDKVPHVAGNFEIDATNKFAVVGVFSPEGYNATYSYGNKVAHRTYKRDGAPVPLETSPTPTPTA